MVHFEINLEMALLPRFLGKKHNRKERKKNLEELDRLDDSFGLACSRGLRRGE